MSYVWTALGTALLTAAVAAWLIWRDRSDDEPDTDFLTDYDPSMEDEP